MKVLFLRTHPTKTDKNEIYITPPWEGKNPWPLIPPSRWKHNCIKHWDNPEGCGKVNTLPGLGLVLLTTPSLSQAEAHLPVHLPTKETPA